MKKYTKIIYFFAIFCVIFLVGFYFGKNSIYKNNLKNLNYCIENPKNNGVVDNGKIVQIRESESQKQEENKQKTSLFSLSIDFGDGKNYSYEKRELKNSSTSLLDFLKTLEIDSSKPFLMKTQDYGSMGILLTEINGYKNGDKNNYWQYFVNGVEPMISIDKYLIKDNDNIELKFTKSKF